MKEREKAIVTGLTILMLVLWLGFVFHRSPRFAGSFWGGILGVSVAVVLTAICVQNAQVISFTVLSFYDPIEVPQYASASGPVTR